MSPTVSSTGGRPQDGSASLIANLTKLEINTIIKENLTARKLPDPANALLDIALTYAWRLADIGFDLQGWFAVGNAGGIPAMTATVAPAEPATLEDLAALDRRLAEVAEAKAPKPVPTIAGDDAPPPGVEEARITLEAATFIRLRWAAWAAAQNPAIKPAERIILDRIRKNCDQLKSLLLSLRGNPGFEAVQGLSRSGLNDIAQTDRSRKRPPLLLDPTDMTTLRKIWEIGVQEVVAQTVIDLDGDSITYIARRYSAPSWSHILDIHRLSVQSAVGFWGQLMGALQRFLTGLASLLTGGGRL
ncbi:MAG: hypothetical protein Kilf2KO_16910 [Rhodospirillales bacterium]